MPTIRHVLLLIQHGDYAFSIDLQDAYLHIPIVNHHHHFLQFAWHNLPYQWKFLPFGLATAPRVFIALSKPILFLGHCKGFHIVIYLDDILVQITLDGQVRGLTHFCVPYWFSLDCILIFPSLTFASSRPLSLCFLGLHWDTVCMSASLPPDKLADFQQLALSFLQTRSVTVHRVMSFSGKANFCASGYFQLWRFFCVIQNDMLTLPLSHPFVFSCLLFLFSFTSTGMVISFAAEPSTIQFPLADKDIATDAMPTHWPFYFQGYDLLLLVSGSWSSSICRAHIALQELPANSMMLHRMLFCLSGKVVTLLLDNSTSKAYLCNEGGTVSPSLPRLACQILSLSGKHSITLIPAYNPTHLIVETNYLSQGQMLPEWHLLPQVAQAAFHLWHLPEVDLLASYYTTQCQH